MKVFRDTDEFSRSNTLYVNRGSEKVNRMWSKRLNCRTNEKKKKMKNEKYYVIELIKKKKRNERFLSIESQSRYIFDVI